jgi:hypothetical protein
MKNIIRLSIIAVMWTVVSQVSAQYKTGIGVRGGYPMGVTVKHFISGNDAVEVILSSRWRGFEITGLYERHAQAFGVSGLNWYYGGGGHIGFYDAYKDHPWFEDEDGSFTVIGIDGVIGLEYEIGDIPFSVGADWKPEFNIIGYTGFWGSSGAISFRYLIK